MDSDEFGPMDGNVVHVDEEEAARLLVTEDAVGFTKVEPKKAKLKTQPPTTKFQGPSPSPTIPSTHPRDPRTQIKTLNLTTKPSTAPKQIHDLMSIITIECLPH
jgi:hypothetical protein